MIWPSWQVTEDMDNSSYKWRILILASLTATLVVAMPAMCLPVLFKEISEDLHLSLVQVGVIWGIGSLPAPLTSLMGGAIGDRFGLRRTLSVACFLIGIAGALRGLANSFYALGAVIILYGMVSPIVVMSLHKVCGVWFPKEQLGLANGFIATGMALGFMTGSMVSATILSPLLGGWRHVLFFYGAVAVAISIPWTLTRPAPAEASAGAAGARLPRQSLSHVVRIRNVWLLGLAVMGIGGCVQGTLGYLPLFLRGQGWTEAGADGALATFHAMSMVCVIPLALSSDKLGSRKKALMAASLFTVTGVGLLSVAQGSLIWVAVILAGLVRDGFMAIVMAAVIEADGVGAAYAGTALGLVMSMSGTGNLISPPLGNSLASVSPRAPFVFWAALAVMGFISLSLVREKRDASVLT
jgi:MFS family permease